MIRNIEEREERLREALVWLSRTAGQRAVQGVEAEAEVTAAMKLRVPQSGTPGRKEVERLIRAAGAWGRVSFLYSPWLEKALRSGAFRDDTRRQIEGLCPRRSSATVRVSARGGWRSGPAYGRR